MRRDLALWVAVSASVAACTGIVGTGVDGSAGGSGGGGSVAGGAGGGSAGGVAGGVGGGAAGGSAGGSAGGVGGGVAGGSAGGLAGGSGGGSGGGASDGGPQLWFYAGHNLQVTANVTTLEGLMDRAADAGYHGVVLSDFKIGLLHTGVLSSAYAPNLAQVLSYAAARRLEVVPAIFPFGYSEAIYYQDKNLAEGQPIVGAQFAVRSDRTLALVPSYQGPTNGGFELHSGDTFTSWSWQDQPGVRTFADTAGAHSGGVAARIGTGAGNARIVQSLTLTARRQYHVRFFVRSQGYSGGEARVAVLDAATGNALNYDVLTVPSTQPWTQVDFTFNSRSSTSVNLYVGVWSQVATGSIWFDDVTVEETALINLIRRAGAPLDAGDSIGPLAEGVDLSPIADPGIAGGFDDWHAPPVVTALDGGRLQTNDRVTMSFYAVTPVAGYQVGACLSEPAVTTWMQANMAAVAQSFPNATGFFLGYDEMRQMNSCGACASRGLTAGALLASHVGQAIAVVRSARPGATLYAWSDMFDPNHNAHDNYYMVEGDLTGSWAGLPADVVVMNWHLGSAPSLAFFSGRGHPQIIAGYYDTGDGATAAASELTAASGISGLRGMMYTTWTNDYSQLEAYAASARAHW